MEKRKNYRYVTLLSSDDYIIGTLCLAESLRKVNSQYDLLVLVTQSISETTLSLLRHEQIDFHILQRSVNTDINSGRYVRWNYTFDKLNVFGLVQYDKVIFLDSDMYVIKNIDHLFESPHMSAVVADVFEQPECTELNSGLMVISPSMQDYNGLLSLANEFFAADMSYYGDQDIIRKYYTNWKNNQDLWLPIDYNMYYPDYAKCKRIASGGGRYCTSCTTKSRGNIHLQHSLGV